MIARLQCFFLLIFILLHPTSTFFVLPLPSLQSIRSSTSLYTSTEASVDEDSSPTLSDVDRKVLESLLESSPGLKSDKAVQELLKSQPARKRVDGPSGPFQSGLLNNIDLWKNEQLAKFDDLTARAALSLYNALEQAVSTVFQIIDERVGDGSRTLKGRSGMGLKMLKQGVRDEGPKGRGARVRNAGEYMKEVVKTTEQRPLGLKVAVDLPKAVGEVGTEVRREVEGRGAGERSRNVVKGFKGVLEGVKEGRKMEVRSIRGRTEERRRLEEFGRTQGKL